IVLSTVGTNDNAVALAQTLVDRRLAACVNIVDRISSVYRWQDAVCEEGEKLPIIQTVASKLPELQAAFPELHPYEVPEFVVVRVDSLSEGYGAWLIEAITGDKP